MVSFPWAAVVQAFRIPVTASRWYRDWMSVRTVSAKVAGRGVVAPFRIPHFRVPFAGGPPGGWGGIPLYGRAKLRAQAFKEGLEMPIFTLISDDELDDRPRSGTRNRKATLHYGNQLTFAP
jgi:hypothetical protein